MKTKVLIGILLFLIVINLSTIGVFVYHGFKGPNEPGPAPMQGMPQPSMMNPVSPMMQMQPEVRERMHALMMKFREDTQDIQTKIFDLEDTTVALLMHDPPPMGRISDNLKQLSDLRLLINQKAIHNLLQAKTFLPPVQQEMFFRAIMQARPQMGRAGGGMMMGGGPQWGRKMPGGRGWPDTLRPHQSQKEKQR
jgi:Spy/CpxP family protein refolding chaperone